MAKSTSLVARTTQSFFAVDGINIPVEIHLERRRNARISCGVDRLYLRIPRFCSLREREKFVLWGEHWAGKMWGKHAWFRSRFQMRLFGDGQLIQTNYDRFELCLEASDLKHYRGNIEEGKISIRVPRKDFDSPDIQAVHLLVHKLLAGYYEDFIREKVLSFNEKHFQKEIRDIRIRLQKTKWGSCSSEAKISLSTKLLFAPENVLDYVIIHELAHLVEHNHSPSYWKLVKQVRPQYQNEERWLKQYGHLCDF